MTYIVELALFTRCLHSRSRQCGKQVVRKRTLQDTLMFTKTLTQAGHTRSFEVQARRRMAGKYP